MLLVLAVVVALIYKQFRGDLIDRRALPLESNRSGLTMDVGAKVTYNGVQIGRVADIEAVGVGDQLKARILLEVRPRYADLIPANVDADIKATTVFGNKYVSLASPKNPTAERITSTDIIDVSNVTTELNTLFETVVSVAEQVDPVKLNQTLAATAQALDGLGTRFGQALLDGNAILADLNPQMPQIRSDIQRLADLADIYSTAAPDLFDGLDNAMTTAHTVNDQRANLDQALLASVGFGDTGADILERGAPYFVRGNHDAVPTTALFDEYSPALFCTIRNYHDVEPKNSAALGGNGYSARTLTPIMGAGNPYVYPDNLPRVNARGGPEGRPGCWQPITRDLWPAPYLVVDTGASIAPYNHFEPGQPLLIEYVWGRQVGENTINP